MIDNNITFNNYFIFLLFLLFLLFLFLCLICFLFLLVFLCFFIFTLLPPEGGLGLLKSSTIVSPTNSVPVFSFINLAVSCATYCLCADSSNIFCVFGL
jgi:hypothetical protein